MSGAWDDDETAALSANAPQPQQVSPLAALHRTAPRAL
jgi:hypothetical protein